VRAIPAAILAATIVSSAAAGPSGTGWVYDPAYLEHVTGPGHPESPERLEAIVARLEQTGLLGRLTPIRPAPAAREWLTAIHSEEYVSEVERGCGEGRHVLDAGDTTICPESYRVALLAAGGVLAAVDAVMAGSVRNAFCAVRPPGHHALKDRAMGFCLFDNVAIAARYVQLRYHVKNVLIVDWDVHHGNGTQAAFYDDPSVLYFSVHESPFYPGTGAETETGTGPGEGYTVNVPLPAGSGDEAYVRAFEGKLRPRALSFRPGFVLISAGFDAQEHDTLGGMKVTPRGYERLTRIVTAIADECCGGRVVSVLEGGYNPEVLAKSVEAHLRALLASG
jgi:acetoin utilization deacetylase AcuC-like enzyme